MLAPVRAGDRIVQRYTDLSSVWATVTPIVLDRHPKQRSLAEAVEEMRRVVADACMRAGLPWPSAVEVSPVSQIPGAPHARSFAPLRRKDGSAPKQMHAVIAFDTPVLGPVVLGAGRFRGYGLCVPYEPASQ